MVKYQRYHSLCSDKFDRITYVMQINLKHTEIKYEQWYSDKYPYINNNNDKFKIFASMQRLHR